MVHSLMTTPSRNRILAPIADSGDVNRTFRRSDKSSKRATLAFAMMPEGYSHRQAEAGGLGDSRGGYSVCGCPFPLY
jgi:hypothetical protein